MKRKREVNSKFYGLLNPISACSPKQQQMHHRNSIKASNPLQQMCCAKPLLMLPFREILYQHELAENIFHKFTLYYFLDFKCQRRQIRRGLRDGRDSRMSSFQRTNLMNKLCKYVQKGLDTLTSAVGGFVRLEISKLPS